MYTGYLARITDEAAGLRWPDKSESQMKCPSNDNMKRARSAGVREYSELPNGKRR